MKVVSVVGARPQFVKAAPLSRFLRGEHHELLVHTGQHYDDALSAAFFRDLEMPDPDANLDVGSGSHATQTAEIMRRLEPLLLEQEPDGIVVYGDTNSTLAAAVVASRIAFAGGRRPWLAHVEAGLRSFNPVMPEERNRIVADHLADLLLAPTATAMRNLAHEGLGDRARLVGDVMLDAFEWAASRAEAHLPAVAADLHGYALLTLHRAENVDDPIRLAALLSGLHGARPLIFPIHPRTRRSIDDAGLTVPDNIRLLDPVGYLAMVALERHAAAIATDSGGVQKEAYLAGVPCVTLRTETEWLETVAAGWNRVIGDEPESAAAAVEEAASMDRAAPRPALFGDGHAAERIVRALEELDRAHAGGAAVLSARPTAARA
ncbi:MAG TPA: UDP-N-acetylglucosamine 2-epimerase (non-hydrolyzing) [Candidatus Limnocylindria bacterium]|nr:UDP-N-acetylglucosamine 2-epimerase (non-hydrolyzing) [Candidatus Limnocylindria bacterium]